MSTHAVTEVGYDLYTATALVAAIDERLWQLSQAGLLASHQRCDGEEAVLVGAAAGMHPHDWVFSGRQVNAAALWRGLSVDDVMRHSLGKDVNEALSQLNVVTVTAGPATRLPHAAGLAWAARHDDVAVLCELGDGAVSDGDFHAGLNFAAVFNAPVVFVIRSEGEIPVVERAEGYGIEGLCIDGRDVEGVRDAVADAAKRGRKGGGPTLIEARITRGQSVVTPGQISGHKDIVEQALAVAERNGSH